MTDPATRANSDADTSSAEPSQPTSPATPNEPTTSTATTEAAPNVPAGPATATAPADSGQPAPLAEPAAPAQPTAPEPAPPATALPDQAVPAAAVTYAPPTYPTTTSPSPDYTPPSGYAYPATYAQPPISQPPKPPGPPKSTLAAILLNLTGLGLGYGYLRRRLFLAIALVGTAGLVTTAFLTDAAGNPWLWRLLTIGWLAILALHAGLIGRRHLPATSKTSTVAGVVAVAVIVAGYVGYGIAGNSVYTSGVNAQKAGDCTTALDRFDTVTGPFELTLSENVSAAEARTVECNAYASALAAQKNGNHDAAISQYKEFGENYPQSALRTFVRNNLAETYVNRVLDWQLPLADRTTIDSGNTLLMVLSEFDDTPAAARVPKAFTDLFEAANSAYRDSDFCGALTTLDYFAKLDPAVAQDVVTAANTDRARALYECGISQLRGGYADASTTLQTFLTDYPQDPGVPQAKSAHITAQVVRAMNVSLPVPPPLGDNSPGDIPVTFYNDSNTAVTILVAGPTAHELSLPPCVVCPATYPPGVEPCPTFDGRPSVTLELTPATYYLLTARESGSIDSYSGSVTPLVGYEHTQCMYVGQG